MRKQLLNLDDKELDKRDYSVIPIGWANLQLFDYQGRLREGEYSIRLWPGAANPHGTTASCPDGPRLQLQFDKAQVGRYHMAHPLPPAKPPVQLSRNVWDVLDEIVASDALYEPVEEEKKLLWACRHALKVKPSALSKLLLSVQWGEPAQVAEMHSLLPQWAPLSASQVRATWPY